MKRVLVYIMLAVFIGGSAGLCLWEWNRGNLLAGDGGIVAALSRQEAERLELQRDLARWYNLNLTSVRKDAGFQEAYWDILDLEDHAMGVLSVPSLDLRLPIYHGQEGGEAGAGHIQTTAFPLGQSGEHSAMTVPVLLEEGDYFYIHILEEVLPYQVTDREVTGTGEGPFPAEEDRTLCTLVWEDGIGTTLLHAAYDPTAPAEETIEVETEPETDRWLLATCLLLVLGMLLVPCLAMTGKG